VGGGKNPPTPPVAVSEDLSEGRRDLEGGKNSKGEERPEGGLKSSASDVRGGMRK